MNQVGHTGGTNTMKIYVEKTEAGKMTSGKEVLTLMIPTFSEQHTDASSHKTLPYY